MRNSECSQLIDCTARFIPLWKDNFSNRVEEARVLEAIGLLAAELSVSLQFEPVKLLHELKR
jgi:hypothetical protein